jgi:FkbM family methyltransferase
VLGRPVALDFVGESRLLTRTGMTGATVNHYVGLYEFEDMAFVLHALRPEDTFVDVGANVGSYTVLAGALAGARGLAIEPVPTTFRHLQDNVNLNAIHDRVTCLNVGVGREESVLRFTAGHDAVNHVATEREAVGGTETVEVPVRRLDDLAAGVAPLFLKVDVEGWETEVIAGAGASLSGAAPMAVLMELNGSGARYGFDEAALHRQMLDYGFAPMLYRPFERTLTALDREWVALGERAGSTVNTLYVRGADFFQERVRAARRFDVLGTQI